jgi:hypothetical protein
MRSGQAGYKMGGERRTFPSVSRLVTLREGKLYGLNGLSMYLPRRAQTYTRALGIDQCFASRYTKGRLTLAL